MNMEDHKHSGLEVIESGAACPICLAQENARLLAANDELEKDKAKLIRWEGEREADLRQRISTLEREKAEITATGIQQRDKTAELEKRVEEMAKACIDRKVQNRELEKRVKELEVKTKLFRN